MSTNSQRCMKPVNCEEYNSDMHNLFSQPYWSGLKIVQKITLLFIQIKRLLSLHFATICTSIITRTCRYG